MVQNLETLPSTTYLCSSIALYTTEALSNLQASGIKKALIASTTYLTVWRLSSVRVISGVTIKQYRAVSSSSISQYGLFRQRSLTRPHHSLQVPFPVIFLEARLLSFTQGLFNGAILLGSWLIIIGTRLITGVQIFIEEYSLLDQDSFLFISTGLVLLYEPGQ